MKHSVTVRVSLSLNIVGNVWGPINKVQNKDLVGFRCFNVEMFYNLGLKMLKTCFEGDSSPCITVLTFVLLFVVGRKAKGKFAKAQVRRFQWDPSLSQCGFMWI